MLSTGLFASGRQSSDRVGAIKRGQSRAVDEQSRDVANIVVMPDESHAIPSSAKHLVNAHPAVAGAKYSIPPPPISGKMSLSEGQYRVRPGCV